MQNAVCESSDFVCIVTVAILHNEEIASPLKPKDLRENMSSNSRIFEVVPLFAISEKSSSAIPVPSSLTSNPFRP